MTFSFPVWRRCHLNKTMQPNGFASINLYVAICYFLPTKPKKNARDCLFCFYNVFFGQTKLLPNSAALQYVLAWSDLFCLCFLWSKLQYALAWSDLFCFCLCLCFLWSKPQYAFAWSDLSSNLCWMAFHLLARCSLMANRDSRRDKLRIVNDKLSIVDLKLLLAWPNVWWRNVLIFHAFDGSEIILQKTTERDERTGWQSGSGGAGLSGVWIINW